MVEAALQRTNMVESQVAPSDVTDHRILRAMREIPRERFVPASLAALAYMDEAMLVTEPGEAKRWLLAPRITGKLLQLADVGSDDHVLDIGGATGYSAAILGQIARSVVALESDEGLAQKARATLAGIGAKNVSVVTGRLNSGWPGKAPYDAIILQGAVTIGLEDVLDQLKDGGCLVAVVKQDGIGKATIWRRLGRSTDPLVVFDASAPDLPGFQKQPEFVL